MAVSVDDCASVHVAIFSAVAKLSIAEIEATRCALVDTGLWPREEACLLRAINQLCADGRVDERTHAQFARDWTREQQLEIFALCGTYQTISFVASMARLPNEPFAARYPSDLY